MASHPNPVAGHCAPTLTESTLMPKPQHATPVVEGATIMPTPAAPTTADATDQAQPTEHTNTLEQVQQLTTERDELTQQISALKTTALNKHLEDNNYAVRTDAMQRLGHDTSELVNADLSINADKLNVMLQSIKSDGFVIEQWDSALDKLIKDNDITDPTHIDLLRTITNPTQRTKVAKVIAQERKNRVNSRVGLGGESTSRGSSLAAGSDLYQSRKREQ